jgi:hypothetical protein
MSSTRPEGEQAHRGENRERSGAAGEPDQEQAERGTEAYGGDPDAESSVTETEVEAGMERDQAEG